MAVSVLNQKANVSNGLDYFTVSNCETHTETMFVTMNRISVDTYC